MQQPWTGTVVAALHPNLSMYVLPPGLARHHFTAELYRTSHDHALVRSTDANCAAAFMQLCCEFKLLSWLQQ